MSTLNDSGAGDEVKQGKYANALILILMSLLTIVGSYFSYQLGQSRREYKATRQEDKIEQEKQREREDKIRTEYQLKLDQREAFHEGKYNTVQMKADSLTRALIDIKIGRVRAEVLVTKSKNTAKSFQEEIRRTENVTKQLDSISHSVSKSLQKK
jgi:anaerobic ribonucleoside-triphosphate reductase